MSAFRTTYLCVMAEQAWYRGWFNSPFYHKLYFERDEKEAENLSINSWHIYNRLPAAAY
jgi:hypothetical protein